MAWRYVEYTNADQADKIGPLFADAAVYSGVSENPMRGADNIKAFYAGLLSRAKPHVPIASSVPAGSRDCYLGLQGTTANASQKALTAIDQFTPDNAGKISRPDTFSALSAAAAANKQ